MIVCALCQKFRVPEALVLMREEKDLGVVGGDPIPFYVRVHADCRDGYQSDKERSFKIAEQLFPFVRRQWAL